MNAGAAAALLLCAALAGPASAALLTSAQDGPWSLSSTWDAGVPTAADEVAIAAGHQVTVDITTATASTTTINGHLYFSRTASSSFTVVGGGVTVEPGGHLDMGTEADVLGTGATAHLVLAYGQTAGQYGLIVKDGGDFTVRGATKSPYGFASASIPADTDTVQVPAAETLGWNLGDTITIAPTTGNGVGTTHEAAITDISAGDPVTVTFAPAIGAARNLSADKRVPVANLTRNVLVRSSGTDTASDTAYLRNLAQNATSFSLAYGEFAYLGANAGAKRGLTVRAGAVASVSSSTFRSGYRGIDLESGSGPSRLAANLVYASAHYGIHVAAQNNTLVGNQAYNCAEIGIRVSDGRNRLEDNFVYSNGSITAGVYLSDAHDNVLKGNHVFSNRSFGIRLFNSSANTLLENVVHDNGSTGIYVLSSENILVGNKIFGHFGDFGISLDNTNDLTFIDNFVYNNSPVGLGTSRNNVWVGGAFGFNAAGNSSSNGGTALTFNSGAGTEQIVLKGARVNPADSFELGGLNETNNHILSYNQSYDTGTVRLWGDYRLSGSTWTFDAALQLHASDATAPKLKRGIGGAHSASVCSTDDADAVSQLVTLEYNGTNWTVTGSSTGAMGTITAGSCRDIGGQAQVNITESGTPAVGDILDFGLIAASKDAGSRKRLLFGPADASFNQGKSQLTIAPSGGIVFRGQEGEHTLIDRLDSGSTYYTFVGSGAFTAHFSSFTNMDLGGIQLSGSKGVALSSSTFDFLGLAGTENAYITARDLTSTEVFDNVRFDTSRTSVGISSANVRVETDDAGLDWTFIGGGGALWGEDYDDDPNGKVRWNDCASVASVQDGPWSVPDTWDGGFVPAACNPAIVAAGHSVTVDIATAAAGATTVNGTLYFSRVAFSSLTIVGGDITVEAGGHLDMGTEAEVLGPSATAHLVLAYGQTAGQFGLIVKDGGDFTVRGATKTPYAFATSDALAGATSLTVYGSTSTGGWQAGDAITIGKTRRSGTNETEERILTSITGGPAYTISWNTGLTHDHDAGLVVANLTRNVLVRSSGTNPGANAAYIRNLVRNTTSFDLSHGEFAYLATGSQSKGIEFAGAGVKGAISSSTVRDGGVGIELVGASGISLTANNVYNHYRGIILGNASNNTLTANNIYGTSQASVRLSAGSNRNIFTGNLLYSSRFGVDSFPGFPSENTFIRNDIFSNREEGLNFGGNCGPKTTLVGNKFHHNFMEGVQLGCDNNTLLDNSVYLNARDGILVTSSGNLLAGNKVYSNSHEEPNAYGGITLRNGGDNTLIANFIYSERDQSIWIDNSSSNTFVGGALGYDPDGNAAANLRREVYLDPASKGDLVLKDVRVNPTVGISKAGFNRAGNHLLSYDQDFDTGTVRLWGDYALSGSTWTFAHDVRVSTSLFTTPKLMRGAGGAHSASVCSTDDANAVSQLITLEYNGANWTVTGSSTGAMGTIPTGSCQDIGGQAQVNITEVTPQTSDKLDFALIAASPVQNIRKRLLFGPAASGFNSGKSQLTIAPSGGIVFRGGEGEHTLIDRLDDSSTYYTFVDSGAFTAHFSSFTNMDLDGIQLSGSKGVALSSSTFDFLGLAGTENAYITARDLTSAATFYSVAFAASRELVGVSSANVRVEGSDAGLRWHFRGLGGTLGALWGEAYDDDPNARVSWDGQLPLNPEVSSVLISSIAVSWGAATPEPDGYVVEAATAADFTGTVESSATANPILTALAVESLAVNTTYYLRVGAVFSGTTNFAAVSPPSTPTLSVPPAPDPPTFFDVFHSSLSVRFSSGTAAGGFNPPGTLYEAEISNDAGFSSLSASSRTSALSATLAGLPAGAIYHARVRSINRAGRPSEYFDQGSTATLANIPGAAAHLSVSSVTVALSWSAEGNAPSVRYEVSQSTDDFLTDVSTPVPFGAGLTATTTDFLSLSPNTTYHHRLRAQDAAGRASGFSATASTVTLAAPPTPLPFSNISNSGFTANWNPRGNPPDTLYVVEVSSDLDFGQIDDASATFNTSASFSGLQADTDYFVRLRAFNRLGIPTEDVLLGGVRTTEGLITIGADVLPDIFTNKSQVRFSAQGADHYHFRLSNVSGAQPLTTEPRFDGSLLTLLVEEGESYFAVRGETSSDSLLGFSEFGPILVDRSSPTISALSAQRSSSDPTPVVSGQSTDASTPRFTWPEPPSFSPIVGYSFAVLTDPLAQPPQTVNTTLTFQDAAFSQEGVFYVKVRALDQAGNWGDSTVFEYVFTDAPLQTRAFPKNNYFNPLRGEKMQVRVETREAGRVTVALYSLNRRKVAILVDQDLPAGTYDFDWTGLNGSGQRVATGVYVIHVEAPGFRKNYKCAVAK